MVRRKKVVLSDSEIAYNFVLKYHSSEEDILSRVEIDTLNLFQRTKNRLREYDVHNLYELTRRSEEEMGARRNFGLCTLLDIKYELERLGLCLRK